MRTSLGSHAAVLLIGLAACGGETNTGDATTVRDSSGVAIVENDLLRLNASCAIGDVPAISIGVDDGGEEYVLDGVNGTRRLSDGRIAIVNQRAWQIRWYGADGRYIRAAGRQGEGPGEFTSPYTMFTRPGDTIYVANTRPFQFLVFGPDGSYLRMVRPQPAIGNPPGAFGVLGDGRLMLAINDGSDGSAEMGMLQRTRRIQLHGADGAVLDTLATMPNGRQGEIVAGSMISTTPFFESYAHAAALDSVIVLGHGAERELRVWSGVPEMRLARVIRWTGGSREVTASDVEAEKAREKRELDAAPSQVRPFMEKAYETQVHPNRPVAELMPSMNGIRLGTDGRIWIREFKPPADTSARQWVAFTREGRFDCRLSTPAFSEFAEFGADYLLAVVRDSLGVERVQQYPLSKP